MHVVSRFVVGDPIDAACVRARVHARLFGGAEQRLKLGRLQLGERIGVGAMGVVYEATDPELGRTVAVKVMRQGLAASHLKEEARALGKLRHPNVVSVHDVGEHEGNLFLVMERIEGCSLREHLATPRAWREIVGLYLEAARGVAAAHAVGLVHRDLKPDNILVDAGGVVKVVDFGLSIREGAEAAPAGTPAYLSPEVAAGGEATAASDQYGLGAALREAVGDARPDWLARVVDRMTAAAPADRYPSIDDAAAALRAGLDRRGRSVRVAAAVALLAAGAGGAYAITGGRDEPRPPAVVPDAGPPPPRAAVTEQRRLTDRGCAYSPAYASSNTLVYDLTADERDNLYRIDVDGTGGKQLTSGERWQWRANPGRRDGEVVYIDTDLVTPDRSEIVTVDLDRGVDVERVTAAANSAAWSDGALYYTVGAGARIRRRTAAGDEVYRSLPPELDAVRLVGGPGGLLAFVGGRDTAPLRACLFSPEDDTPRCLDVAPRDARPAFSPAGDALYYVADDGIHRHTIDRGRDELVVPGVDAAGGIAVAPDGSSLAWSSCRPRARLVDASTMATIVDEPTVRHPSVGPGGRRAWIEGASGESRVVIDAGGQRSVIAGGALGHAQAVALDDDGTQLAITVGGDHPGVYLVRAVPGASPNQLTDGHDERPTWTRDGKIAYQRFDDQDVPHVFVVDPRGGAPVQGPAASRQISDVNRKTGELLLMGSVGLVWWDPVSGHERPLEDFDQTGIPPDIRFYGATISPDGGWLLLQLGTAGNSLWRVRLDARRLAAEHVADLPAAGTPGDAVIEDDGHVLVAPSAWIGDLFVVPALPGQTF